MPTVGHHLKTIKSVTSLYRYILYGECYTNKLMIYKKKCSIKLAESDFHFCSVHMMKIVVLDD